MALTFKETIEATNSLVSEGFIANECIKSPMPTEVGVSWELNVRGFENVALYHKKHNHRMIFSVNHGEFYFETSEAKGKEIMRFLELFR